MRRWRRKRQFTFAWTKYVYLMFSRRLGISVRYQITFQPHLIEWMQLKKKCIRRRSSSTSSPRNEWSWRRKRFLFGKILENIEIMLMKWKELESCGFLWQLTPYLMLQKGKDDHIWRYRLPLWIIADSKSVKALNLGSM